MALRVVMSLSSGELNQLRIQKIKTS